MTHGCDKHKERNHLGCEEIVSYFAAFRHSLLRTWENVTVREETKEILKTEAKAMRTTINDLIISLLSRKP